MKTGTRVNSCTFNGDQWLADVYDYGTLIVNTGADEPPYSVEWDSGDRDDFTATKMHTGCPEISFVRAHSQRKRTPATDALHARLSGESC